MIVGGHECHFDEDAHLYTIDGAEVISVTQALVESSLIDTTWFTEWARHRGSTVHKALEYKVQGILDEESIDPKIQGYLDAYHRFVDEAGFECLEVERSVWSPTHRFAGTLDQFGTLKGDYTAIVDTKTGALQWQTATQLTGYDDARSQNGDEHADRLVGLQLNADGTYGTKAYPLELLDWRAALRIAWRKRRK